MSAQSTPSTLSTLPNGSITNYSGYFVEKSISELVMGFINERKDKTFSNIFFGITILIGADIIKSIALDLVKEQKKQITDEILNITKHLNIFYPLKYSFRLISSSLGKISYQFNRLFIDKSFNVNKDNIVKFEKNSNEIYYNLDTTNIFLSNLEKYIMNEKNCCTFEKIEDTDLKFDRNKIFNNIIYSNIKIPYSNAVIKIYNQITTDGKNIDCEVASCSNIFEELMEYFIDLIDDSGVSLIDIKIENLVNNIKFKIGNYCITYMKIPNNDVVNYKSRGEVVILHFLCCKYEKILIQPIITPYMKKIIISAWLISSQMICYSVFKCSEINNLIRNKFSKYNIDELTSIYNIEYSFLADIKTKKNAYLLTYIAGYIHIHKIMIAKKISEESNKKIVNKVETNYKIKFGLVLDKKNDDNRYKEENNSINTNNINNTNQIIKNLINQINNQSLVFDNKNKIKIYTAKVETNILTKSKPNPAYIKYFDEKKKLLDNDKNISSEKILQLLGIEPEKELEYENIEKEVKVNYTNERYTSFSNLYLSDSQDEKLKTLLNSFQEDKERLEELGIPNKLCLLLHGEPGTGKTTTIITTASYFNRDIFYISLKNISNDELKMIFDYVNEKHSNQGIIVLEDFDAMTKVVSKRSTITTNPTPTTTTDLYDNIDNELTLDFFLNILDGTLTSNNSIVIMTTNHLENIDPAIYRAGRVDSLIEMKKSDHTQIKKIFKRFISRDIDSNVLERIKEYEHEPAKIIFRLKEYIKLTDLTDEEIMKPFLNK